MIVTKFYSQVLSCQPSDSDVILCLQLLSRTLKCTLYLSWNESIDHLCINPILRIGLIHKWSIKYKSLINLQTKHEVTVTFGLQDNSFLDLYNFSDTCKYIYSKCSKILNISQIKCWLTRLKFTKCLSEEKNQVNPDTVCLGLFDRQLLFKTLEHLLYPGKAEFMNWNWLLIGWKYHRSSTWSAVQINYCIQEKLNSWTGTGCWLDGNIIDLALDRRYRLNISAIQSVVQI